MQNIIIIGSGGHAVSCIDVILSTKKFKIQGYISDEQNPDLLENGKTYEVWSPYDAFAAEKTLTDMLQEHLQPKTTK